MSSISPASGDLGPIWSSAIGGGLGSRGELAGDIGEAIIVVVLDNRLFGDSCGFRRGWGRGSKDSCSLLLLAARKETEESARTKAAVALVRLLA
jgi:hypothetical protein